MDTASDASSVLAPHIIVADDDELSLILLQDGLKGMGFQPAGCRSGKEAVLLALKRLPEAIILDDKMPGLDSTRTIRLIRIMEPIRAVPVILLVERPDKDTVMRAVQMGANDCVSKDTSLHDINLRLQRAIKAPPRRTTPLYDELRYFFHFDDTALLLDIDGEITTDSGRNLVELVRSLTGLMPVKLVLSLERVPAIAASGIGYLSDVKDTVQNCGGTIFLAQGDFKRFLPNVQRFLDKYFQLDAQVVAGRNPPA